MNILIIISVLYIVCSIIYIANLWIQNNNYSKIGLYIGILGFLVQSYYLINLLIRGDLVLGGLGKSLFLFAWFIPFGVSNNPPLPLNSISIICDLHSGVWYFINQIMY